MDGNDPSARDAPRREATGTGGTVEPVRHTRPSIDRPDLSREAAGPRFELYDPFAEVSYRSNTFEAMAARAEQLGASRFIAVDADGRRMPVQKIDGEWRTLPPREVEPGAQPVQLAQPATRSPSPDAAATRTEPGRDRDGRSSAPSTSPTAPAPVEPAPDRSVASADAKAERAAMIARLEAALAERYLIKRAPVTVGELMIGHTEYRFRGDTSRVAFTESTFRLATDTNSPSVARSMVDVAQARNWRSLRVSGNEDFRRMVWLEASARGVRSVGYEPNPADLELLKREREARAVNRIEPEQTAASAAGTEAPAGKSSVRGGGGRKTVLAAIEAVLVAKRVPASQREAVIAAAGEQLARRQRDGQPLPKIRVYDATAPSRRPVTVLPPEVQRTRERTAPAR